MKWSGTPGLLFGLSLCYNVDSKVSQEMSMDSARDGPRRERQSAGLKKWKCSALAELHELLRNVWQA